MQKLRKVCYYNWQFGLSLSHNNVVTRMHCWPFVRGIRKDSFHKGWVKHTGLILGLHPANESLQSNTVSHWLGANLESALAYSVDDFFVVSLTSCWTPLMTTSSQWDDIYLSVKPDPICFIMISKKITNFMFIDFTDDSHELAGVSVALTAKIQ